jgi:sulfide:quinone oxidoreductase
MVKRIIIAGGGAGGLITANKLAQDLSMQLKREEVSITVIDPAEYNEFQPGYIGIAFKGETPDSMRRRTSSLILNGINLVRDKCAKIIPENSKIVTGSGKTMDYDYLVVSTGCEPDYSQIEGLAKDNLDYHTSAEKSLNVYRAMTSMKSGRIVAGIAGLPYKCPPSPNEAALLLDEFFARSGLRDKVSINFITPYIRVYPAEPINEVIEPLFRERNIETNTGFTVDRIDTDRKKVISLEGDEIPYDSLMLVPPHKPGDYLKGQEFTDDEGWIKTDKIDLHISTYENAFAIGDVTNIPISKAGVEAHLQGIVVAENIRNDIVGSGVKALFTGRTQCSMETGYGKATFVIGTYAKPVLRLAPSKDKYLMKKMMEAMYWDAILGRTESIFKAYFGDDYIQYKTRQVQVPA